MNDKHQIGRVTVRCTVAGQKVSHETAVGLANETADALSTFCRERLPALLDMAFRKANISDQEGFVSIDRLDVDLGKIRLSRLEETLAKELEGRLRQAQNIAMPMPFQGWFFRIVSSYLETGVSPWNSGNLGTQGWREGLFALCEDPGFREYLHRQTAKQGDVVMRRMAALLDGLGMEADEWNRYSQESSAPSLASGRPESALVNDPITIGNAGLVLLAPFLSFFFKRLGLLDEDYRFPGDAQCAKAIRILQRVMSPGEDVFVEGDLSLNKLLCGWPLSAPLPLTDGETGGYGDEIARLLDAVIEQWSALKDSSREELTITFLRRPGVLRMQAVKSLNVEWQSQDVLLKTLPWPLSIIQTPWMAAPLTVIWE